MSISRKTKILVIEDDPTWSLFVETIISESDYQLVDSANTIEKAAAMIEGLKPDVLISEIILKDSSIFDFISDEKYKDIPIIFMTNHLDSETYNLSTTIPKSTFLAKPFHKFTLLSTLNLLLSKYPIERDTTKQYIAVRGKQQQIKKLMLDEIVFIQVEGNYSFINTSTNKKYARKKALNTFLKELDSRFIRVHKSHIINKDFVRRIDLGNLLILVHETTLALGRGYRKELEKFFEQTN